MAFVPMIQMFSSRWNEFAIIANKMAASYSYIKVKIKCGLMMWYDRRILPTEVRVITITSEWAR